MEKMKNRLVWNELLQAYSPDKNSVKATKQLVNHMNKTSGARKDIRINEPGKGSLLIQPVPSRLKNIFNFRSLISFIRQHSSARKTHCISKENTFSPSGITFLCVGNTFPRVGNTFPRVGNTFPCVGNTFPCVGNTFPCVGNTFPCVGNTFPCVGNTFPCVGNTFPFVGNIFPVAGYIFLQVGTAYRLEDSPN